MKSSIQDVAQLAHVSISTVSRSFTRPDLVSKATRDKVMKAADELNFSISRSAAALKTGRALRIAVLVSGRLNLWFSSSIIEGLNQIFHDEGYDISIYQMSSIEERREFFDMLPVRRNVDAVIVISFDIDANGIVHVSAKDKGTGKEQSMTITGGSGLGKDEIDRMVKEAEAHEAEDKQRKEDAETRNNAENFAYQTEKLVNDNKDKLSDDVAKEVTDKVNELKEALKGEDIEKIKSAQSELMTSAQKIGQALYAQQGAADAAGAAGAAGSAPADDDVVDAEVVDDDDKDNK